MKKNFYALSIACVFRITCTCSLGPKKSPSGVVLEALKAANEGRYAEAEKYLSFNLMDAIKEAHESFPSFAPDLKAFLNEWTRNRTIERTTILDEEIRGDIAKVRYRIQFKDGITKEYEKNLIKEGGQWKITA